MKSFFSHAGIAALIFFALIFLPHPIAAAMGGILYYLGREGLDAQFSTGLPKSETTFMPFMPWTWPKQMLLDVLGPIIATGLLAAYWIFFNPFMFF